MTRFTETGDVRLERERFFTGHGRGTIAPSKRLQVGFKRLTEDAVIPTKAHATDSGFDLVASADIIVEPGETVVVPTGIAVILPEGYEATVRPRSGVTAKTKLRVQLGTIDEGYGGEVGVIVDNINAFDEDSRRKRVTLINGRFEDVLSIRLPLNNGNNVNGTYYIRKGDRIAQLVITRLPDVEAIEVFDVGESSRGDNGFGSTGVSVD